MENKYLGVKLNTDCGAKNFLFQVQVLLKQSQKLEQLDLLGAEVDIIEAGYH